MNTNYEQNLSYYLLHLHNGHTVGHIMILKQFAFQNRYNMEYLVLNTYLRRTKI